MNWRASIFILPVALSRLAVAADLPNSGDHPQVPRYPGSEIIAYERQEFDEYELFAGPADREGNVAKTIALEGRVTHIVYALHENRSSLEVLRNYEIAFEERDFEVLYACKKDDCGGRAFQEAIAGYGKDHFPYMIFGGYEALPEQRYLAAKLTRPQEGDLYVAVYVTQYLTRGGGGPPAAYIGVDVVELKPMDVGMELKLAREMQQEIDQSGRAVLYGILFDFDSANIKPESKPAIEEIATLLKESPDLELLVVGHTDSQGTLDYNLDLSRRRAGSVVSSLVGEHGIAPGRLEAHGVGFLAPVATNKTDEGRALNRRVELVER